MITLTEAAEAHFRAQLDRNENYESIRVGVSGAGCGGYTYYLKFEEKSEPWDKEFIKNGIKIISDPKSLILIDGLEIDFECGDFHEKVLFNNPNATSCGCGESFSI